MSPEHEPQSGRPSAVPSRETIFLKGLLAGSFVGPSASDVKLKHQVALVISTLGELEQEVIKLRFGFGGGEELSYDAIAGLLSASLDPKFREELARKWGVSAEEVSISAEDVMSIEAEALRNLSTRKQSR